MVEGRPMRNRHTYQRLAGLLLLVAWFAAIPFAMTYSDLGFWGALRFSGGVLVAATAGLAFVAIGFVACFLVATGASDA